MVAPTPPATGVESPPLNPPKPLCHTNPPLRGGLRGVIRNNTENMVFTPPERGVLNPPTDFPGNSKNSLKRKDRDPNQIKSQICPFEINLWIFFGITPYHPHSWGSSPWLVCPLAHPPSTPNLGGAEPWLAYPLAYPVAFTPPLHPSPEGCDRGVYGGDPRGGCGGVHGGEFLIPEHAFANGNACPGMRNH